MTSNLSGLIPAHKARHAASRLSGFTLVELLVALALSTAVVALGSGLWHAHTKAVQNASAWQTERQNLRDSFAKASHYWSRREAEHFESSDTGYAFSVRMPVTGRGRANIACRQDEKAGGWTLLIGFESAGIAATDRLGAAQAVAATGLSLCRVSFLSPPMAAGSAPNWVTHWPADTPAPNLLRLDLAGTRGPVPPLIVAAGS